MIVITLTAVAPKGPVILTECKNAHLQDGDRLHCEPDLANALCARYPDNLTRSPYWDKPLMPAGQKWEIERAEAPPVIATTPTGIPVADRSMGNQRNKQRADSRGKEALLGG